MSGCTPVLVNRRRRTPPGLPIGRHAPAEIAVRSLAWIAAVRNPVPRDAAAGVA